MKGSALAIPPKGLPFGNPICFETLVNLGAGDKPLPLCASHARLAKTSGVSRF